MTVIPLERRVLRSAVEVVGEVRPLRSSEIGSEVEGRVAQVLTDEGRAIGAKKPMLRLETTLVAIRERRAKAELDGAKAQLLELRRGSRAEDLAEAAQAVAQAHALLAEAERDLVRMRGMREDASEQARTAALSRRDAAVAELRRREAVHARLVAGPRPEEIAAAEAMEALRQAALDEIVEERRKAEIKAPFAGVITKKYVEVGHFIRRGDPLFSLMQVNPIHVVLAVPEAWIDDVHEKQELTIRLDAIPADRFRGTVDAIVPLADVRARTFPVKVRLSNESLRIMAGMSARVALPVTTPAPVLALPRDALVRSPRGVVVFAVRSGRAVRIEVRTGMTDEGWIEVRGELQAGEPIVLRGNERLMPGQPVEIVAGQRP